MLQDDAALVAQVLMGENPPSLRIVLAAIR
jgi:hypothetical protein